MDKKNFLVIMLRKCWVRVARAMVGRKNHCARYANQMLHCLPLPNYLITFYPANSFSSLCGICPGARRSFSFV